MTSRFGVSAGKVVYYTRIQLGQQSGKGKNGMAGEKRTAARGDGAKGSSLLQGLQTLAGQLQDVVGQLQDIVDQIQGGDADRQAQGTDAPQSPGSSRQATPAETPAAAVSAAPAEPAAPAEAPRAADDAVDEDAAESAGAQPVAGGVGQAVQDLSTLPPEITDQLRNIVEQLQSVQGTDS